MTQANGDEYSPEQHMRAGLIGYLEVASSADDQREYQKSVPYVHVPNQIAEMWNDYMGEDGLSVAGAPLFTSEEIDALHAFHEIWNDVTDALPYDEMDLEQLLQDSDWHRLIRAAGAARDIMMKRGRFPKI